MEEARLVCERVARRIFVEPSDLSPGRQVDGEGRWLVRSHRGGIRYNRDIRRSRLEASTDDRAADRADDKAPDDEANDRNGEQPSRGHRGREVPFLVESRLRVDERQNRKDDGEQQ